MMPMPAKITKNSQPMMQKKAIVRMKIETGIERVSCTPVANFAAVISSGDKKSSAAILSSQFETRLRRMNMQLRISVSSGFISMRNVLFADTVKDSIPISVSLMSRQKMTVNAATTTITPSVQEQADRQRSPVGGCSISIVS